MTALTYLTLAGISVHEYRRRILRASPGTWVPTAATKVCPTPSMVPSVRVVSQLYDAASFVELRLRAAGSFCSAAIALGYFFAMRASNSAESLAKVLAFRLALGFDFVHEADEAVVAVVRFRDELLEHLFARTPSPRRCSGVRRRASWLTVAMSSSMPTRWCFISISSCRAWASARMSRPLIRKAAMATKRDARHNQDKRHAPPQRPADLA